MTIKVEDYLYEFFRKIGQQAGGLPPEQVMADTLFKFAGEWSVQMMKKKGKM